MTIAATPTHRHPGRRRAGTTDAWQRVRRRARGRTASTSGTSSSATTPRTSATRAFLQGPTERTTAMWNRLAAMFPAERERGIYDVDAHTPSTITSHAPGYIDRDNELIVGLQTDAPLKRAIMPNGGWRMVEDALVTYGYQPDPQIKKIFTNYRKTHNQGVFDVYPPKVRAARRSHIITGLPDSYGRGRIIGDYRRVALYGVDALVDAKKIERAALDLLRSRRGRHPRPRGKHRADPGAARTQGDGARLRLRHLRSGRDRAGSRAVAVLRLPRRGQGAERRRDVAGPHVDLPGHLPAAGSGRRPDHRDAGAGTDRRPGDQAAHRAVPAHPGVRLAVLRRPDLGDRIDRRDRRGRPAAGHPHVVPDAADALQPRPGARSRT